VNRSHCKSCFGLDLFKRPAKDRRFMAQIGKLGDGRLLDNGLNWSGCGSHHWRRSWRFLGSFVFRSRNLFEIRTQFAEMDPHSFRDIVIDRA